jgi:hypothetical protein
MIKINIKKSKQQVFKDKRSTRRQHVALDVWVYHSVQSAATSHAPVYVPSTSSIIFYLSSTSLKIN